MGLYKLRFGLVEALRVVGDVHGVALQGFEGDDLQSHFARGGKDHRCCGAVVVCAQPVVSGHTPPVTGLETGESKGRDRGQQIIADRGLVFEKLTGDDRTDGVTPDVLLGGLTTPVAEPSGDRVNGALFERAPEHFERHHPSKATLRPPTTKQSVAKLISPVRRNAERRNPIGR